MDKKSALLTLTLLVTPVVLAATLNETQLTATKDLSVHASGTAYITVTPAGPLLEGANPTGLVLADWSAGVTAGTVAFRFNPTLVAPFSSLLPATGILSARTKPEQKINVILSAGSGCTSPSVVNDWMVCPEATSMVSDGKVKLLQNMQVLPGAYMMGIDTVVWGF
ncbi:TPA: hypothetical protein ACS70L_003377 [Providencia alcalifaciens]